MNKTDLLNFSKITAGVFANFRAIATEPLLDMWFDMATEDGITIEQWTSAARFILKSRKFTSQPTYADFHEFIFGPVLFFRIAISCFSESPEMRAASGVATASGTPADFASIKALSESLL